MNIEELELDDDIIKMDGYDDCIIGVASRCGFPDILAYDTEKIISRLVEDSNGEMTVDEAHEYMMFNMVGAYVGERTPIFIFKCE
jgi:hypothetical protein